MRFTCGISAVVFLLVIVGPLAADDDAKLVEGAWRPVKMLYNGRKTTPPAVYRKMVLIRERGTYRSAGSVQPKTTGKYELDITQDPKWITQTSESGKTYRGIYKFDGKKRMICVFATSSRGPRPKTFECKPGGGTTLVEYERLDEGSAESASAQ